MQASTGTLLERTYYSGRLMILAVCVSISFCPCELGFLQEMEKKLNVTRAIQEKGSH